MFVVGTAVLLAKLYEVQVVGAAEAREDHNSQSTRRLQTAGRRGRILDASGVVLADSRACRNLVCRPEAFKSSGGISNVAAAVDAAMDRLAETVRLPRRVSAEDIARHLRRESPLPIVAYRDVDSRALALFADSADELRGFEIETTSERVYPYGPLAVHVVGYTGTGTPESGAQGVVIHYTQTKTRIARMIAAHEELLGE